MSDANALCILILSALLGRFITLPRSTLAATRVLSTRWVPLAVGLITIVFMTWLWGGLDQVAVVHDEAAYLMQARIYAGGHWTAPGLPLPEFFEQYHVFVTPLLTAKYPPGHALMLVPGIWVGLPGLVPVLLIGLTGGLVFEVARRLTNPWIGLLSWLLWMTAPGVMLFEPTYLSETTTSALWMLGWLALLKWIEDDRGGWLILLAACIGIGFLSRPVTMVVFTLPVAIVVIARVARHRSWRQLLPPAGVGAACLAVWFLWCERTTGNPLLAPYGLYSRYYFPDDVMGFGLTGFKPLRTLNPDMAAFNQAIISMHRDYVLAALPSQLRARIAAIGANMWATRTMLLPLAGIALITTSSPFWFAWGSSLLLVAAYVCVGHSPKWSVYYVEIQPVLAFATAAGWWRLMSIGSLRRFAWPLRTVPEATPSAVFAVVTSALLLMPYITRMVPNVASNKVEGSAYFKNFRALLTLPPDDHIMVFVRYAPNHNPNMSLVRNEPDLASARAWTVYDRGAENIRLMQLDRNRTPYLFDDERRLLIPLDSAGAPRYERQIREPGSRY